MTRMAAGGAGRARLLRVPGRGAGRLSRIGLFSVAPLVLAGGAHILGGGTLPAGGVVFAAVGLLLISSCVSVRQCRLPLLVGLLGVEQLLLHLLFTTAESAVKCMPAASTSGPHGAHGGSPGLDSATGVAVGACTEGHVMSPDWQMIAAHAVATAITAWLLSRGEAWWWATFAELVHIASARPTRRLPRPTHVFAVRRCAASRLSLAIASPRGPPLFSWK